MSRTPEELAAERERLAALVGVTTEKMERDRLERLVNEPREIEEGSSLAKLIEDFDATLSTDAQFDAYINPSKIVTSDYNEKVGGIYEGFDSPEALREGLETFYNTLDPEQQVTYLLIVNNAGEYSQTFRDVLDDFYADHIKEALNHEGPSSDATESPVTAAPDNEGLDIKTGGSSVISFMFNSLAEMITPEEKVELQNQPAVNDADIQGAAPPQTTLDKVAP